MNKDKNIYYGWWVLLACITGLIVGPGQFAFGSLGLFIPSLENEFGWSRSQIGLALTIFTVTLAVASPVIGRMIDNYGSKQVLVPALVALALCLAAIPALVEELWHFYLVFFLIGSLGAAANSLPFMFTISSWFNRRRGLAIGLAMTGSGLGYALVPPVIQHINSGMGWHWGYYTLSGIVIFLALPIILLLFRNHPADLGLLADGEITSSESSKAHEPALAGFNREEALRQSSFWLLVLIFSSIAFGLFGLLVHLFPMLTDLGMPDKKAAGVQAVVGWTIVFVRAPIGYLLDRFFAPRVAQCCFVLSAAGIAVLSLAPGGALVYLAAVLTGFSIGAEIDLLAFLAGRYFGLRNYGEIFGLLFASMMLGVSLGPPVFGLCYDITGNYSLVLYFSCALLLIATLLTHQLSDYPDFAT